VRKTKDNELIVIHDPLTLRTTKYLGFVNKMTLDKVKTLKTKANQEIPTMRELIEVTRDRIRLLCEIKVRRIFFQVFSPLILSLYHRLKPLKYQEMEFHLCLKLHYNQLLNRL